MLFFGLRLKLWLLLFNLKLLLLYSISNFQIIASLFDFLMSALKHDLKLHSRLNYGCAPYSIINYNSSVRFRIKVLMLNHSFQITALVFNLKCVIIFYFELQFCIHVSLCFFFQLYIQYTFTSFYFYCFLLL